MVILLNLNWRKSKEIGRMSKYFPVMPLELFYISEQLKKSNIKHKLIDLWLKNKSIRNIKDDFIVVNSAPSYVFWRDGTTGIKLIKKSIKKLKRINPKSKIILIGPHGTITPELFPECIVIKGEPEFKITELIKSNKNSETKEIPDLDKLRIDYSKVSKEYKRIFYETSRGCPFNCTFCFKEGFRNKFRLKSINKIKEDLKNIEDNKIEEIYLIDECFGFNKKWSEQVINEFKKYNIKYSFETRPELLSKEFIDLISETNCKKIEIGLESADPEVLRRMNKSTINLEKLKENILYMIEKGITPHFFLIIGSEGETKQSLKNTLKYIKQFPNKVISTAGISTPFPGTELWKHGLKQGKKLKPWKNINKFEGTINNSFDNLSIQKQFILFSLKLKNKLVYKPLIILFNILPKQIFYKRILFNNIRRLYHLL